ncbi:MAG: hypothetical protein AAF282_04405 [Cyanobacteria bacterium P01_A01_bin.15]
MPSSSRPYQSKLLQTLLQRLQNGLGRQRRAWRQVQSTAVWAAQLALLPVYKLLQQTVERSSFGGSAHQPAQLDSTEDRAKVSQPILQILAYTQTLLPTAQVIRLWPPVQLSPTKNNGLKQRIQQFFTQGFWPRANLPTAPSHSLPAHTGSDLAPAPKANSSTTDPINGLVIRRSLHQTVLASSLAQKNIVLVTAKQQVIDVFSPKQQQQLNDYISQVMTAYWQFRTTLLSERIQQHHGISSASLPQVKVRKPRLRLWPLFPKKQIRSGPKPPLLDSFSPLATRSSSKIAHQTNSTLVTTAPTESFRNPSSKTLEAQVDFTRYIEHPLETILRWVDRILTWLEQHWHQWVSKHHSSNK